MTPSVYFDNAATTQIREEVISVVTDVMKNNYGNASSTHSFGRSSKSLIEQCRKDVSAYFKVSPSEIIFTSGGTEADNLVLRSTARDLGVKTFITSKIEHHAILHTLYGQSLKNNAEFFIEYFATDLIMDENGSCQGLIAWKLDDGTIHRFRRQTR